MKKQMTTILAALSVSAAAFAANPFSDVPANHWAYQSVSELAAAGIIDGYPDGTYKGGNEITRYEMAQMTAKAMAHADKADAQQRAVINQLADEFSNELNSLGVRVDNLEKKIGNVQVTGDFRMRYQGISGDNKKDAVAFMDPMGNGKDSKFDMRARVQFNAQVAEGTEAVVRLSSDDVEFGNNTDSHVWMDLGYLSQDLGPHANLQVGRTELFVGQGLLYDDTFDGAVLRVGNDHVTLTGAYGYLQQADLFGSFDSWFDRGNTGDVEKSSDSPEVGFVQLEGSAGNFTAEAFYMQMGKSADYKDTTDNTTVWGYDKVYGAGASYAAGAFTLGGEWTRAKLKSDIVSVNDSDAWTAYIGYKGADYNEPGSYGVQVNYFDLDAGSGVFSTTYDPYYLQNLYGATAWHAAVTYVPVKNMDITLGYSFNVKMKEQKNGGISTPERDLPDYAIVQVGYHF